MNKKDPVEEVLGENIKAENRIKKIIFEKKEADFYKNKKNKEERDLIFQIEEEKRPIPKSMLWKRSESLTQKEKKTLYDKKDLNTTIS